MTFFYKAVETPGDPLKLMSHKTLAVVLENFDLKRVRLGELLEAVDHPILERAEDQLSHFSAGTRRSFHIEPRTRRLRIPEGHLEGTASASLRQDTLIRDDRKCRWRSKGGPRRRCGKRQEVASKSACSAVQSYIAPLRQCVVSIKSRCSKLLETACDPFRTERHYMREPGPKWLGTHRVVAEKRSPRQRPNGFDPRPYRFRANARHYWTDRDKLLLTR
ncbi:hypothetical protein ACVWWG_000266 [Bradyrhizobium sp. LB7.2]